MYFKTSRRLVDAVDCDKLPQKLRHYGHYFGLKVIFHKELSHTAHQLFGITLPEGRHNA